MTFLPQRAFNFENILSNRPVRARLTLIVDPAKNDHAGRNRLEHPYKVGVFVFPFPFQVLPPFELLSVRAIIQTPLVGGAPESEICTHYQHYAPEAVFLQPSTRAPFKTAKISGRISRPFNGRMIFVHSRHACVRSDCRLTIQRLPLCYPLVSYPGGWIWQCSWFCLRWINMFS